MHAVHRLKVLLGVRKYFFIAKNLSKNSCRPGKQKGYFTVRTYFSWTNFTQIVKTFQTKNVSCYSSFDCFPLRHRRVQPDQLAREEQGPTERHSRRPDEAGGEQVRRLRLFLNSNICSNYLIFFLGLSMTSSRTTPVRPTSRRTPEGTTRSNFRKKTKKKQQIISSLGAARRRRAAARLSPPSTRSS